MSACGWQFAIDVGGTFTDVFARRPDGLFATCKILSSAGTKGALAEGSTGAVIVDPARAGDPEDFWTGYRLEIHDCAGACRVAVVTGFESAGGRLHVDPELPFTPSVGMRYELFSDEPSPLLAMRYLMGLRLDEPLGEVDVRLGSTRSTNALLERKGAPTALVTTAGFGDILYVGNQDRPRLFDLNIRKPEPIITRVVEIAERIDARGRVLRPLDLEDTREKLADLRHEGPVCLAICLLNAFANPEHERQVAAIARAFEFENVSVSTEVSPLHRIVPRGDTTAVDAYLAPVISSYVAAIRTGMPRGRLRLMTSAGGLVAADRVAAKDTLLSGPAGGVVGFARVGWLAGFDKCIGFDMGGTSTDVARYDGRFDYQFETVKGGVRVVAPMMAIETVAAGGGSICAFDGHRLTVGPHSAGAAPGPACYGAGGPLTLTDVNLFLGRILGDRFPFPLDRAAVEGRLSALQAGVADARGGRLSARELAEGLLRIANENMAAAIRRISVAQGYDPADYTLVTFGGAGAQHACAVADLLGIRQILISPLAGILSAYGIAVADVKRFAERMVQTTWDAAALDRIEPVFRTMEEQLRSEIALDGVASNNIQPPTRMLDMRYAGEDSCITVAGDGGDFGAAFERMHEQLYGYRHADRVIEVVAARVEMIGETPKPPVETHPTVERNPDAAEFIACVFNGASQRTSVFDRDELHAGDAITGPAIVLESNSTVVIDPGWSARVLPTGDLLLATASTADRRPAVATTEADPIQLELFSNRFAAIAERMGTTLQRTALSTNVKERLDFSCAIFTAAGDLLVNAPHVPVHLGSMADCVKAVLARVPELADGDVIVTNDPYHGGTHVPDVTCVTPVFDREGRSIIFFVASRAHHAEIGGKRPGSMPADSTCLAEEGVLIRDFKILDRGAWRGPQLRRLLTEAEYPSRAPDENVADIAAQVAANTCGARELRDLVAVYRRPALATHAQNIQRAAEEKMRAALRAMPQGRQCFRDRLDDGSVIAVAIDIRDGSAHIDFAGTSGVHPGNFNANRAIVTSAVLYCFRCLIADDIPLNAGVLSPLEITIPPGMLDPPADDDPQKCPAVAAGNVETSQRIVDVVFGALQTAAASQGTMNNLIFGNERFGYYETIGGGAGAGRDFDGADAVHTHMTNTRQTDPEVFESRYPALLWRLAIRRGSGGTGRHRGGDGIIREIEFLEPVSVSIISQRRTVPPYGLAGGMPGAAGRNLVIRAGNTEEELLDPVAQFEVSAGDRLIIETPGGGGFGAA